MQNLSQKELRLIAKNRDICGYKSMPKDKPTFVPRAILEKMR